MADDKKEEMQGIMGLAHSANEGRLRKLQSDLARERKSLDDERTKLAQEFSSRETSLVAQLNAIRNTLTVREKDIEARISASEDNRNSLMTAMTKQREEFDREQEDLRLEIEVKNTDLAKRKADLDIRIVQFDQEKIQYEHENQKKLQENCIDFVKTTVDTLSDTEKSLSVTSWYWSISGGVAFIFGVISLICLSYISYPVTSSDMSWPLLSFYAIKGCVIAGILITFGRYAFLLSKRYFHESLRTADRIHALKFGQLYVETYGISAEWEQVKEVFANWNNTVKPKETENGDGDLELISLSALRELSGLPVEKLMEFVKSMRN